MEPFTVHCPLGECHGAVRVRTGMGIYYVRAYEGDPRRAVGYREPDPDATVGGERFVDERHRHQLTVRCTDGHYLRLSLAEESVLDPDECVYGPVEADRVRCPDCQYAFGSWPEFVLRTPGPTERTHELTAVAATSPPGYADVSDLTREALQAHDRLAHRRDCPNCGSLVAFAYDKR